MCTLIGRMKHKGKGLLPHQPDLRTSTLSAQCLLDLLATRHSEDVFIPECKDGPSQGTSHLRLDARAMARSWSRPRVSGYEIKVSRSDFVKDEKWQFYLQYCNVFYFVCPYGLIQPNELPPEVGLLWGSSTGSRLFEKKKAAYREVVVPENMYRYILMGRVRVSKSRYESVQSRKEYWQRWLREREEDRELGYLVGKKIRELIRKRITEVNIKMDELKAQMRQYDNLIEFLKSTGHTSDGQVYAEYIKRKMRDDQLKVPSPLPRLLDNVINELERFKQHVQTLRKDEASSNMTE